MNEVIKKYYGIFFITLLISSLVFSFIYFGFKKNSEDLFVRQVATWNVPPIVINCPDSIYSMEEVNLVIQNWENRGHEFLGVTDGLECHSEKLPGFIQITLMGQDLISEHSVGETVTSIDIETKEIIAAMVTSSNPDPIVLEHEIGHALGYKHIGVEGHIMYPYYHDIGTDDRGLFINK